MLSYSIVINGALPPIRAVLFGGKGVFTEDVVVLIQRLFVDAGLLAVSSVATYRGLQEVHGSEETHTLEHDAYEGQIGIPGARQSW